MIHHYKDIFKFITCKVWKKNYVSLASFSEIIRFNRFYFYIFSCFRKKEDFIQFFIFLLNLLFDFVNHLRVSSFWKLSVLPYSKLSSSPLSSPPVNLEKSWLLTISLKKFILKILELEITSKKIFLIFIFIMYDTAII